MKSSHILMIGRAAASLCATLFLCACTNEIEKGDGDGTAAEFATVTFSVNAVAGDQPLSTKGMTEDEENAVVYKEIKEAQETIDTTPADRTEVIEECKLRIAVYSEFAPKRMDEAAIRQVIEQTLAELGLENPTVKDKGKLMKSLMPKLNGKAEGALVNRLVGTYLG